MTDKQVKQAKSDWKEAQNDAQFHQSNLIEIVRFLARSAAERDFKQQINAQDKGGGDD